MSRHEPSAATQLTLGPMPLLRAHGGHGHQAEDHGDDDDE
jgi:hypothetical protein